eukprot:GHVS01065209.1.p1 GENE.GHVS01065209.1~~GHVS01065209.1.p1  ORF type:complete len:109 (+),score=15.74 GHVS01065209.1:175-501(+)
MLGGVAAVRRPLPNHAAEAPSLVECSKGHFLCTSSLYFFVFMATQATSSGVCLQHAVVCVYYAQCVRLQHTRRHKAVVFVKNTQRCLFTTSSGVCLHPPVMCIYGQCT